MAIGASRPLKRRHHFLPIKYQEGFCQNENGRLLLWWFNRKRQTLLRQQPINLAVQKDYYSIPNSDGKLDDSLENDFTEVEGEAWPVIEKLDAGNSISVGDKKMLSLFLAILTCRTPEFDESIRQMGEELAKAFVQRGWFDRAPEELTQHSRVKVIEAIRRMPAELAPLIASFDWAVLHAPKGTSFVLTDDPLIVIAPPNFPRRHRGIGFSTPGVRKIVPLTAGTCLVMEEPLNRFTHYNANSQMVNEINHDLAVRCFHDIFSRDEGVLRSLVESAGLKNTDPGPRVVVG